MRIRIKYGTQVVIDLIGLDGLEESIKAAVLFADEVGVALESIEIVSS